MNVRLKTATAVKHAPTLQEVSIVCAEIRLVTVRLVTL
jgi:hypothetical protein